MDTVAARLRLVQAAARARAVLLEVSEREELDDQLRAEVYDAEEQLREALFPSDDEPESHGARRG